MAEGSEATLDYLLAQALLRSSAASPRDALLVALHSNLLSAGFVCVATGDEGFEDETTGQPEAVSTPRKPELPTGWNASDVVCLQYRYKAERQKCLLKAIPLGDQLLISAAVGHTDKVFTLTIKQSKYVKDGPAYNNPSVFINPLELMSVIQGEIEAKLSQECERSSHGTTKVAPQSESAPGLTPGIGEERSPHFPPSIDPLEPSRPDPLEIRDPLRIGPRRLPYGDPDPLGEFGPFGYGDRDRLPGVGGGGGMIFDPRHNRGRGGASGVGPLGPYPPGHPPGARFDPVSPLRPPIRPRPPHPGRGYYGPDPDHLPPPGYDDMFS